MCADVYSTYIYVGYLLCIGAYIMWNCVCFGVCLSCMCLCSMYGYCAYFICIMCLCVHSASVCIVSTLCVVNVLYVHCM